MLDKFCGNAARYCVGGDIFRYNRAGRHNGILADCHSAQNRHIRSNPHITPYAYRRRDIVGPAGRPQVMVDCSHDAIVADKNVIFNVDTSVVLEFAPCIYKNILAEMDILAEIGLKRSHHPNRLMNVGTREPAQQLSLLFISVRIIVIVESDALRFIIAPVHQFMSRRTGLNRFPSLHHFQKFLQKHSRFLSDCFSVYKIIP